MAGKAGVKFELGIQASAEDVLKYKPDAVILATGSTMIWPLGMPEAWREDGIILDLRTMAAEMLQVPVKQPGTAVIYDMDHTDGTYSAAELFLEKFDRVIIVSPREQIAKDEPVVRQQSIYQRIYKKGVEVVLLSEPSEKSRSSPIRHRAARMTNWQSRCARLASNCT
jgi:dimethylglycine catabolism A